MKTTLAHLSCIVLRKIGYIIYQVAFIHRPVFGHGYPSSGYPRQWVLRRHDSDVLIVRLRRYPPGRPGYPAEGWVVFLNATWYERPIVGTRLTEVWKV